MYYNVITALHALAYITLTTLIEFFMVRREH